MTIFFNKFKLLKLLFKPKKIRIDRLQNFRDFGKPSRQWWGTFQIEEGQSRFWRIGNVIICVDRFVNEWHLASSTVSDLKTPLPEEETATEKLNILADQLHFKTFTFHTQAEITLKPVLADRPLASKLERSLYIPGGEEIMLYVSSPVWVRIETGKSKIILDEIPTFFLSDTWFGNNTLEGELCYAGHTYCSPHLKDVPSGPDRIISPMLIKNTSITTLLLEKLRVPLPFLSVYADEENYLWTEQLNVTYGNNMPPEIEITKGSPRASEHLQKLSPARKEVLANSGFKKFFNSSPWR